MAAAGVCSSAVDNWLLSMHCDAVTLPSCRTCGGSSRAARRRCNPTPSRCPPSCRRRRPPHPLPTTARRGRSRSGGARPMTCWQRYIYVHYTIEHSCARTQSAIPFVKNPVTDDEQQSERSSTVCQCRLPPGCLRVGLHCYAHMLWRSTPITEYSCTSMFLAAMPRPMPRLLMRLSFCDLCAAHDAVLGDAVGRARAAAATEGGAGAGAAASAAAAATVAGEPRRQAPQSCGHAQVWLPLDV